MITNMRDRIFSIFVNSEDVKHIREYYRIKKIIDDIDKNSSKETDYKDCPENLEKMSTLCSNLWHKLLDIQEYCGKRDYIGKKGIRYLTSESIFILEQKANSLYNYYYNLYDIVTYETESEDEEF